MTKRNLWFANFSVVVGVCLLLTGCAVGPNYPGTPRMSITKQYETPVDQTIASGGQIAKDWWKVFNDSLLDYLIAETEKNNLNLAQAAARVYEARYAVTVQFGGYLPTLNSSGSVTGEENMHTATMYNAHEYFTAGLDASWELDLFGRVQRSVEAAEAGVGYAKEDYNDVLTSLYAEVARTYIGIRTTQLQLATTRKNIEAQRESLELTQNLLKHGLATSLDEAQAERMLASSETMLPTLEMALSQQINAIGILLGKEPKYFQDMLAEPRDIPVATSQINVAVPTNLIRQRPDIRKAERYMAQAVANIGVAEAELYPRLTLSGVLNFGALDFSNLFTSTARAYSFGPTLSWNIFNGGKIRANIKIQDTRALQTIYQYEATVLNALGEVENAMHNMFQYKVQYLSQEKVVTYARKEQDLALSLYKQGLVGFQSVLDAQMAVFSAENELAAAKGQAAVNYVVLYKALGGGWDPFNPPTIPNMDDLIKEVENTGTLNNKARIHPTAVN